MQYPFNTLMWKKNPKNVDIYTFLKMFLFYDLGISEMLLTNL